MYFANMHGSNLSKIYSTGAQLLSCTFESAQFRSTNSANPYSFNLRIRTEPEFLNTLKCNLAESVSTGFKFNCHDIFNDLHHFFQVC
jgi:uncharacterized protein YjbI with pentapeptide repeats